jgi:hypothetical protein
MMTIMARTPSNQFYGELLSKVVINGADAAWLMGRGFRRIAAASDEATFNAAKAETINEVATWIWQVNDEALAAIDDDAVEAAVGQLFLDGYCGSPSWVEHPVHTSHDDVAPPWE